MEGKGLGAGALRAAEVGADVPMYIKKSKRVQNRSLRKKPSVTSISNCQTVPSKRESTVGEESGIPLCEETFPTSSKKSKAFASVASAR